MRIITLMVLYYGCALYSMINPVFGLLFFIQIVIFRPESLVWGNPVFGHLHLFTATLVVIGSLIHRKAALVQSWDVHQRNDLFIFGAFILWLICVSFVAEISVQMSLDKTLELAKIFLICIILVKLIKTEKEIDLYLWVTIVSFGLLSFWGFLQALAGNERLDTLWPGGSNYIGAQLALMTPLAMAKAMDSRSQFKTKMVFLGCAVTMVLCMLATQSRGAFLGLCVGMIAFLMSVRYRIRALAIAALMAILAYPWVLQSSYERLGTIFVTPEQRDVSAESRPVLWKIAFRIWEDYPIAGIGLDNFSLVKDRYATRVSDIVKSDDMQYEIFRGLRYPHGMYTGLLVETGLIGIGLFLLLLLRNIFIRLPKQSANESAYLIARGVQAGLIGFAAAAVFGDFQYIEMFYFQMFFLGAVRLSAASRVAVGQTTEQYAGVAHQGLARSA